MRNRTVTVVLAGLALLAGCRPEVDYRAQEPDPELLHEAMQQLTDVIVYDIFSPPQASRAYSYASVAAYEALRPAYPDYRSLAGQLNGLRPPPAPEPGAEIHYPAAGVHAFLTVGRALTFSQERMDSVRVAMRERFRRAGVPDEVLESSTAHGERVAEHVLAWAREDRYVQTRSFPKFTVTAEPGTWIPTPPAYMDAVEPHWAVVRPFVLDSASQFRPRPPVPYDMTEGSPFYRQVREVYEAGVRMTPEQRAIAAFWDCNPYVMNVRGHAMFATKKITPGGHWIGIAAIAARQSGADLMRTADAYVRTSVALADGFISSWDEKFRSNLVRPETVINEHLDESWQPLLQTPPFPEYTSGHSVISTAAATVLTDLFGDGFAYTDDVEVPYGIPPRSFSSFREAAEEAAISRLYGGIHYRMAIEEGITQGQGVGEHIVHRLRTRGDAMPRHTMNDAPAGRR